MFWPWLKAESLFELIWYSLWLIWTSQAASFTFYPENSGTRRIWHELLLSSRGLLQPLPFPHLLAFLRDDSFMWKVLNLCMSQIWRKLYQHCSLKCFSVSRAQHCPPTLTRLSFQCLLWKLVGCFRLRTNRNSNFFFLFVRQCLFATKKKKAKILSEMSEHEVIYSSSALAVSHAQSALFQQRNLHCLKTIIKLVFYHFKRMERIQMEQQQTEFRFKLK